MKKQWILLSMVSAIFCASAFGELVSKEIEYEAQGVSMKGYLVYDDAIAGPRPGVLVVHEWWGLNDYARRRARMLAELGYTAFAVDMYGQGRTAEHPQEAGEFAAAVRTNRPAARARFGAAMEVLRKQDTVLADKIAAVGYCFGGSIVLQMAMDGVDLGGVVSFHGSLNVEYPQDKPAVKAGILICHGAADPLISDPQIAAFKEDLKKADADWQMIYYGKAVHSFSNPEAGDDPTKSSAYDKKADNRSWAAMKQFLSEVFGDAAHH